MTAIRDVHPVARKRHRCEECWRFIEVGERYHDYFGSWDGETITNKACERCSELRVLIGRTDDNYFECYYGGLDPWIGERTWCEFPGEPDIQLLRAIAGFKNKWLTRQGNQWPSLKSQGSSTEGKSK